MVELGSFWLYYFKWLLDKKSIDSTMFKSENWIFSFVNAVNIQSNV